MVILRKTSIATAITLLTVFFLSCGGDSTGTPGAEGIWNPIFELVAPVYCETASLEEPFINTEVDAYFYPFPCNPADPGSRPEVFTDHKLLLYVFNADFPGNPGSAYQVTLNRFHIDFRRPETAGDTAPILESIDLFQTISIPPVNLEDDIDDIPTFIYLNLVDLATKDEYRRQYDSGERVPPDFPTRYIAVVTMYGSSIIDDNISAVVQVEFTIGSFDYCPCSE